jgi:hypothetical protein
MITTTALTFTLQSLQGGRLLGIGLICLDGRYASVLWTQAQRIDRRFAAPAEWRDLAREIDIGPNSGPIPATSTLVRLLAGDRVKECVVQRLSSESVTVERPELLSWVLDTKLRELAGRAGVTPSHARPAVAGEDTPTAT